MGQRFAAMRAQRQGSLSSEPRHNKEPDTVRNDASANSAAVTTDHNVGFVLGADESPHSAPGREASSSQAPTFKIELVPHQHTLFCERKERVCTASGKFQELEYLRLTGDIKSLTNVIWVRSATVDGGNASDIVGSEGKDKYQLSVLDVGSYISARAAFINDPGVVHNANGFVGPILAGPPRLLEVSIIGDFTEGNPVVATPSYIGGIEGASEYWWLRINKGKRENVSEPKEIDPNDGSYNTIIRAIENKGTVDASWLKSPGVAIDPRVHILTPDDIGCELKVKCRPIRSDGVRGEVFTSKACPKISAAVRRLDSPAPDGTASSTVAIVPTSEGVLL